MRTELITANHAAGEAATLAGRANRHGRGFGSGVYPITPQTECIEYLCAQEIEKGAVVRVESEHSAMAVCIGVSLSGARSFTASSSNGLAYMVENVYAAAFTRLPIVMMAVNRTLGPPWNIWVDHGDTLMLRDAGWITLYCEDNQEVFDTTLLAFKLAEDPRVLLPVLVCQDAFVLSHTMMSTQIPDQDTVDAFLPTLRLGHQLSNRPRTVGALDFPHETEVHRIQMLDAFARVPEVYEEVCDSFEKHFGRRPASAVVGYQTEDADTIVVSMGTTAATAKRSVDELRKAGHKVGSVRLRMHRPFPYEALRQQFAGKKRIAIIDRDVSPGLGGVLANEMACCVEPGTLKQGYIMGLGGGDIRPDHITGVFEDIMKRDVTGADVVLEVA